MDTARDIVIILVSVIGTVFFAVLIVALVWIALSIKGLIKDVKGLMDDEITPTLRSVREGVNSVRGAATVASSVGASAAGGNAFKALSLAMGARRVLGMVRSRGK